MMQKWLALILLLFSSAIHAQDNLVLNPSFLFMDVGENELPTEVAFKGDFLASKSWKDKGGLNYFVVSEIHHPREFKNELYVYQYVLSQGKTTLVWDIKDFPTALCMARVIENSLEILDLDGDGYMETSFIYQFQCDGLDPTVTKLMLHSKGQKLAIRGNIPVSADMGTPKKNVDPAAAQFPKEFGNFASQEWDDFVNASSLIEYAKSIHSRHTDFVLLEKEYLMASGGVEFELLTAKGKKVPLTQEIREFIRYASDLRFMPDNRHLFIASLPKIGLLDLKTFEFKSWVTLFEDTEALSTVEWSPSGSRLAFVTLNMDRYPQHTRVFVLQIEGDKLIEKQKFDVPAEFIVASSYSLSPVSFHGEHSVMYKEKHPQPGKIGNRMKNIELE